MPSRWTTDYLKKGATTRTRFATSRLFLLCASFTVMFLIIVNYKEELLRQGQCTYSVLEPQQKPIEAPAHRKFSHLPFQDLLAQDVLSKNLSSQNLPSQDFSFQDLLSQNLPSQNLPSQDFPFQDLLSQNLPNLPPIYVITATYQRLEQKADLTRLSYTLRLVYNVHWIVVEDSKNKTRLVENFLKKSGLLYTHLSAASLRKATRRAKDSQQLMHRGVEQRNAGLEWLRSNAQHLQRDGEGVVYFADDDNTYSLQLFDEMRFTKKVSVWPVGLLGDLRFETPIVQNEKVVGWYAWYPKRRFAIDMCGFGVNLKLLLDKPKARFTYSYLGGVLETNFLSSLGITMEDLEPRASMCTEILVWHTRTEKTLIKHGRLSKYVHVNDDVINKGELIRKFTSNSRYYEV